MKEVIVFLLVIGAAFAADPMITEIHANAQGSNEAGYEWIEVYNPGPGDINLTGWLLGESGGEHLIMHESGIFSASSYAVIADDIAQFKSRHAFNGTLYYANWASLKNTGETIYIRDRFANVIDNVTYDNKANADGKSIELKSLGLDNSDMDNWEVTESGGTPGYGPGSVPEFGIFGVFGIFGILGLFLYRRHNI